MGLSFWQLAIIAAVVIILFGRGKIPELMGDMAKGIRNFRKGISEDDEKPLDGDKVLNHSGAQTVDQGKAGIKRDSKTV